MILKSLRLISGKFLYCINWTVHKLRIIYIFGISSSVVHSRNSSIPSNCSGPSRGTNTSGDYSGPCSGSSSRRPSKLSSRKSSCVPRKSSQGGGELASPEESPVIKVFRVAMLGAPDVGKSALTSQFLSSDHMNTYDTVGMFVIFVTVSGIRAWRRFFPGVLNLKIIHIPIWMVVVFLWLLSIAEDDVQKVVSLCVDGKESRIIFIDHKHTEMSVSNAVCEN